MRRRFPRDMCRTTNNRMELMAAIEGLEVLNRPCQVSLYSDSRYLTDAFNKGWIDNWVAKGWNRGKSGPVKNIDLWKRLLQAKKPHQVSLSGVKGHAGHPENERCDKLATSAADGTDLLVDEGAGGRLSLLASCGMAVLTYLLRCITPFIFIFTVRFFCAKIPVTDEV